MRSGAGAKPSAYRHIRNPVKRGCQRGSQYYRYRDFQSGDESRKTGATFTLTGLGVTGVAGAVTYAGTTATFTPTAALSSNILYTAAITTGAKDPSGIALAANYVWTFTTIAQPSVTSTSPSRGAINVPIR
jgi:hypothetical protein